MNTTPKGKYQNPQKRIEELEAKLVVLTERIHRQDESMKIMASLINDRNYAIAMLTLANVQLTLCFAPDVVRTTLEAVRQRTVPNEPLKPEETDDDGDKV